MRLTKNRALIQRADVGAAGGGGLSIAVTVSLKDVEEDLDRTAVKPVARRRFVEVGSNAGDRREYVCTTKAESTAENRPAYMKLVREKKRRSRIIIGHTKTRRVLISSS